MTIAAHRPIDCDVHITLPPGLQTLLPYMDDYWRDHLTNRGTDKLNLVLTAQPLGAPIMGRADWRTPGKVPGSELAALQRHALDAFGSRAAIARCVHTAQVFYSEDMAAAVCRALNDLIAREWLDREPRLRASIVVPAQSPELAVQEIERRASDHRFVDVQLLSMNEMPLGRRAYWPIYEAAQRLDLPIAIHAGGGLRCAPTPIGWPSFFVEDYVGHAQVFQSVLLSLITEGVFSKFPDLKVVLVESGFTWLPGFLWRADKTWRGVRREVPWVTESPSVLTRRHVRFTLQPDNGPPDPDAWERVLEHLGSDDLLLFSTDYPHWHYDAQDALPKGFPSRLLQKVLVDNPLATYSRLRAAPAETAKETAL
jgi:predicted TIM-barrel fold metal-dependent hydrolase